MLKRVTTQLFQEDFLVKVFAATLWEPRSQLRKKLSFWVILIVKRLLQSHTPYTSCSQGAQKWALSSWHISQSYIERHWTYSTNAFLVWDCVTKSEIKLSLLRCVHSSKMYIFSSLVKEQQVKWSPSFSTNPSTKFIVSWWPGLVRTWGSELWAHLK